MIKPNDKILIASLREHEGFSATPYRCPAGYLTIGYGTNLDAGITYAQAEALVAEHLKVDMAWLVEHYPWVQDVSPQRQRALVEMLYQLGARGFASFKRTLAAAAEGDWERAARGVESSKWARQTPVRTEHVARLFRAG